MRVGTCFQAFYPMAVLLVRYAAADDSCFLTAACTEVADRSPWTVFIGSATVPPNDQTLWISLDHQAGTLTQNSNHCWEMNLQQLVADGPGPDGMGSLSERWDLALAAMHRQGDVRLCNLNETLPISLAFQKGPSCMVQFESFEWFGCNGLYGNARLVVEGVEPRSTQLAAWLPQGLPCIRDCAVAEVHAFAKAAHWRAALKLGDPLAARDRFFEEWRERTEWTEWMRLDGTLLPLDPARVGPAELRMSIHSI
jgi:hypothetical protein